MWQSKSLRWWWNVSHLSSVFPVSHTHSHSPAWKRQTLALSICLRRCLSSSRILTSSMCSCGSWRKSPWSPTSTNCSTCQAGKELNHVAIYPWRPRVAGPLGTFFECIEVNMGSSDAIPGLTALHNLQSNSPCPQIKPDLQSCYKSL